MTFCLSLSFEKDWKNSVSDKLVILTRPEEQKVHNYSFPNKKDECWKNLAKCTFLFPGLLRKSNNQPTNEQPLSFSAVLLCVQTTSWKKAQLCTWTFLFQWRTFNHDTYIFPSYVWLQNIVSKRRTQTWKKWSDWWPGLSELPFSRRAILTPSCLFAVWCCERSRVWMQEVFFSVIWHF